MALSLKQFVQQLEDSGIISGDTLKDFIPPKASPKDVEELARELIRQKKLTKYQAEEVHRGRAKSLVLGNYVLSEKIGAGGMGLVFKAEHRRMHRTVAIKLLPPHMTKDVAAIARFEREVTAAAKLRHPNIVAADDADCANGVHFLVMEMVEGSDLSALVKKNGPFSVEKSVNYVLQAAKGLEFAHHEGVVHRDIKPANLLLDKKGVVKILDMGLARLNGNVDTPKQAELTSTGMLMGTVDYMAPEQALNTKMADARADIYALGCSLYYLLTGKATYDGDSLMAKLLAHRDQTIPSLSAVRSEVPEQVEAVFKKMVAKTVQDRYQTMTEVIVELERCMVSSPTSVSIQQPATTAFEDGTFNFPKKPHEKRSMLAKPPQKSAPGKSGSGKHRFALIGAAFVGIAILGGIIVSLQTKDGTLIVEVDQPDANVQVLDADCNNSIEMKFRLLPSGKFSIGVHEVTQSQYESVMGANPSYFKGANNPVEHLTWDDAVAFCAKLSSLPAEVAAGRVYRLPTEAEWEYACRAGTTMAYSFGDDEKDLGKYAWFSDNSGGTTHGVGEKLPNGWGLYDMHGNVWEWCSDADDSHRVRRGGSWNNVVAHCRAAYRDRRDPTYRISDLGFRLALSFPSGQSPEAEQDK